MDIKSVILITRHDIGRDLTQDEENMIYNAYQSGKADGAWKTANDIENYIKNKNITCRVGEKRKEYTKDPNVIKYNECERCNKELPETQCFNRGVGDECMFICDECIRREIEYGNIAEPTEDEDPEEYGYCLTKQGKYQKIKEIKDEIEWMQKQISNLEGEIEKNCKNVWEYQELEYQNEYNSWDD